VKKAHDLVILINGHGDLFAAFSARATAKKTEENARMYDSLVVDVETRWDSELALVERVVYFDSVFLEMYGIPQLGIPVECILDRFEFDLAYGMTLVLTPLRVFTKFVQNRNKVTLAYVPRLIDDLISSLAPGSFAARMMGRTPESLLELEKFQACLVTSIRARFSDWFEGDSLALEALYLTPGPDRFVFTNFVITPAILDDVRANIVDDVIELLPPNTPQARIDLHRQVATYMLQLARSRLDDANQDLDPLVWWPENPDLSALFPAAKMLFSMPASTGEDERGFSSAGFTLNQRRSRLDLDNFRHEHRIRHFLTADADYNSQNGRRERLLRAHGLLEEYARLVQVAAAAPAGAPADAPAGENH